MRDQYICFNEKQIQWGKEMGFHDWDTRLLDKQGPEDFLHQRIAIVLWRHERKDKPFECSILEHLQEVDGFGDTMNEAVSEALGMATQRVIDDGYLRFLNEFKEKLNGMVVCGND